MSGLRRVASWLAFVAAVAVSVVGSTGARADEASSIFKRAAPATVLILIREGNGLRIGGGVIVDATGLVVTNRHVIEGAAADQIAAFLYDPTEQRSDERIQDYVRSHAARAKKVEVRQIDRHEDLAVLALPPGVTYPTLEIGDTGKLAIGEDVFAIGAPHGLTWSLAPGVVSQIRKSSIQTTCPINPGNSGGPLLDRAGRLVGINTYISGEGQGLSFALPAEMVTGLLGRPAMNAFAHGHGQPGSGAPAINTPQPAMSDTERAAQWRPGRAMKEAVAKVVGAAIAMTANTQFGFVAATSIAGAFLPEGRRVSVRIPLEAHRRYAVVGGGGETALDVDLAVYSEEGMMVAEDRKDNDSPSVEFTAAQAGTYRIEMHLAKAQDAAFCVFALLVKDVGTKIPLANLEVALSGAITLGARAGGKGGGARFHDEAGESALYGMLVPSGTAITLAGLGVEKGRHAFVAASDDASANVDLVLYDGAGNPVARDEEKNGAPSIIIGTDGRPCSLSVANRSPAWRLVIAALLDVDGTD